MLKDVSFVLLFQTKNGTIYCLLWMEQGWNLRQDPENYFHEQIERLWQGQVDRRPERTIDQPQKKLERAGEREGGINDRQGQFSLGQLLDSNKDNILRSESDRPFSINAVRYSLYSKDRQTSFVEDRKLPGICPGATTIVAPKSVGSRTTNGQMKVIS